MAEIKFFGGEIMAKIEDDVIHGGQNMKEKDLPIKVWLDEDSCWNTKPQGEGYTEYIRKDIVQQGKKEMLEKVFEWIDEHIYDRKYEIRDNEGIWVDTDELLADLKKTIGL